MKKYLFAVLSVALLLSVPTNSHAFFPIDTGTPTNGPLSGAGLGASSQWLAGEFVLSQPETIISVEGYFTDLANQFNPNTGTITAKIYGDAGDHPDDTSTLFSQLFTITGGSGADWYGATGINVPLNAGEYWLAFESGTYKGGMPDGAPDPLDNYAFKPFFGPPAFHVWKTIEGSPQSYGFRVEAEGNGPHIGTNVVPEPASMLLLSGGLAGAFLRRRRS